MTYEDKEINASHGDVFVLERGIYFWRTKRWGKSTFKFRCGPVPDIRCRRHGGTYYRCMSHMPIRRAYFKALDDGVPLRQKWVEIPDPWDDYPRREKKNRNWKRFRKTQYKVLTED